MSAPPVDLDIAITGSSGRLGGALARALGAAGHRVRGIDRRPGPATTVVGDLASMAIEPVLASCRLVVHCAALHVPDLGTVDRAAFQGANVETTERLLAASHRVGVERFVFTSTTSVYGRRFEDPQVAAWVDEALIPLPRDVYDETKLAAEQLVSGHHGDGFETITLRIARCFPEPDRTMVVNRLHRGVGLRDVIVALRLAIEAPLDRHHTLNIAGPRVFERSDVERLRGDAATVIAERLPWLGVEFRARGWALPDSIDRVYVSDRAADVLGYRPVEGVATVLAGHPPTRSSETPVLRAC